MDFAAACTRTSGDVFGTELAIETGLEGGDFLGGVWGDFGTVVEKWVGCCGGVFMLVAGSG